jgi:uncharacterized protein YkwD
MEPIQISVSVELNFSQDVKNFLTALVSSKAENAPASAAPAAKPVTEAKPVAKPVTEAKPVAKPVTEAKPAAQAETTAPEISIEQVRQALTAKVNEHRAEIKAKLNSLGAPSVTKLDPAKYAEMLTFLNNL